LGRHLEQDEEKPVNQIEEDKFVDCADSPPVSLPKEKLTITPSMKLPKLKTDKKIIDIGFDEPICTDKLFYRNIAYVGTNRENRLVTRVRFCGAYHRALFDSGAQLNLVPRSVLDDAGVSYVRSNLSVRGFGTLGPLYAVGTVTLSVDVHGLTLEPIEFLVMEDSHLGGLVILGVPILKANNLILYPREHRISKEFPDGTLWDCHLRPDEEGCRIIWSRIRE